MININNICKTYMMKNNAVKALDNLSLNFPIKGLVFILGKSGCGKSTLLNILGGIDTITSGEVLVDDIDITKLSNKQLDVYRSNKVGFIFQEYNLIEEYNVEGNLSISLELCGIQGTSSLINSVLESVELGGYNKRKPSELSGGQKQRVAIARALIKDPAIILADEPTGNLDSATSKEIFELHRAIARNKLVIIVSHDGDSAIKYGDRIITLVDGKLADDSPNTPLPYSDYPAMEDNFRSVNNESISSNKIGDKQQSNSTNKQPKYRNRISIKKLTKLSFINIWKKKFRLIATMLLFFFSLTLFGVGISGWSFDITKVAYNTYNEYKIKQLDFTLKANENGRPNYINEEEITRIEQSSNKHQFHRIYGKKGLQYFLDLNKNNNDYNPRTYATMDNETLSQFGYTISAGKLATNSKEFCISNFLADKMIEMRDIVGVKTYTDFIGKEMTVFGYGKMKIVGVIDTNFQTIYDNLRKAIPEHERFLTTMSSAYASDYSDCLMVHESFINNSLYNSENNKINFNANYYHNDIIKTHFVSERIYQQSYATGELKDTFGEIIYANGKINLENEELIVSKSIMRDIASVQFETSNITNDMLKQTLNSDCIIERAVLENDSESSKYVDFKIIGYYEDDAETGQRGIIVSDDQVKSIFSGNGVVELITTMINNKSADLSLLEFLHDNGYRISSYVEYDIDIMEHNANVLKTLGLGIALAFGLFSILMMYNFISSSIKSNMKQIGVLRALGMSNMGIAYIFIIESLIVCLLSFVIALCSIYPLTIALSFLSIPNIAVINAFVIDFAVIGYMFAFSILLGVVSSSIPIIIKSRKTPLRLINE